MNKAFMTYREECERLREELQAAREEVSALLSVRDKQEAYMANQGKQLAAAKAEIELNEINLGLAVDYQKQLISDFHAERTELKQQLAARDLVIKQMRGFVATIDSDVDKSVIGALSTTGFRALNKAIALQPTQEALEEFVQKAIEHSAVMRAARLLYSWASNWNSEFMNDPDWINEDGPLVRKALNISTV